MLIQPRAMTPQPDHSCSVRTRIHAVALAPAKRRMFEKATAPTIVAMTMQAHAMPTLRCTSISGVADRVKSAEVAEARTSSAVSDPRLPCRKEMLGWWRQ